VFYIASWSDVATPGTFLVPLGSICPTMLVGVGRERQGRTLGDNDDTVARFWVVAITAVPLALESSRASKKAVVTPKPS
jgi:hypothetical protein